MFGMREVSYSEARARLAELLNRVSDDHEVVRIHRQRGSDAVLLDADEYASLAETAHLLNSPANVRHLLRALGELQAGQGKSYTDVDDLWRDLADEPEPDSTLGFPPGGIPADLPAALKESHEPARRASGELRGSQRRRRPA